VLLPFYKSCRQQTTILDRLFSSTLQKLSTCFLSSYILLVYLEALSKFISLLMD